MRAIILTGGIASGKSTARQQFESLGIQSVCADQIAREVVDEDFNVLNQIMHHYGLGILNDEGKLDRKALGEIIFQDANEKRWLENLLHPIIQDEIYRQFLKTTSRYTILDIPLLTQQNRQHYDYAEAVIIIDTPEALQVERLFHRDGLSEAEARQRLSNQISREERLSLANYIVENSGNLEQLKERVTQTHLQLI